jgi:hypothetical protein
VDRADRLAHARLAAEVAQRHRDEQEHDQHDADDVGDDAVALQRSGSPLPSLLPCSASQARWRLYAASSSSSSSAGGGACRCTTAAASGRRLAVLDPARVALVEHELDPQEDGEAGEQPPLDGVAVVLPGPAVAAALVPLPQADPASTTTAATNSACSPATAG